MNRFVDMKKGKTEKEKIVATLTYGRVCPKGIFIVVLYGLIGSIIAIPGIIYWAIDESAYGVLAGLIPFGIFGFGFAFFIGFHAKINKKIKQWKKDAVKLWAVTKTVGNITNTFLGVQKIKIAVKFYYNDQKIKQTSGELNDIRESIFYMQPGYDAVFQKYANKQIEILYSPSYNQVMILKPAKNKKSEG